MIIHITKKELKEALVWSLTAVEIYGTVKSKDKKYNNSKVVSVIGDEVAKRLAGGIIAYLSVYDKEK